MDGEMGRVWGGLELAEKESDEEGGYGGRPRPRARTRAGRRGEGGVVEGRMRGRWGGGEGGGRRRGGGALLHSVWI